MTGPLRTCIASRRSLPREDLVRLVVSPDGELIVDGRGRLPGRGVWLEPSSEALSLLDKRRKSVEKHLGARVDPATVRDQLETWLQRTIADGLSIAAAAGALALGADAVEQALRQQVMAAGLFAADAADRTKRKAQAASDDRVMWATIPWTREELGAKVGRGPMAVVGVRHGRATTFVRRQLRLSLRLG